MKSTIFILLAMTLFSTTALANECPALLDTAQYDAHDLKPYKLLTEGKNGWIFRSENDFKHDFFLDNKTTTHLAKLNKGLEKKGIKLVIALLPTRGSIGYENINDDDVKSYNLPSKESLWQSYENRISQLKTIGINTVGADKETVETTNFFYKQDHHWTAEGARLMAKAIADNVSALPLYKDLPHSEFVTQKTKNISYKGTFTKVYKTLCGYDLEPEKAPYYETKAKGDASGAELFDDINHPVVLVGTSNSVNQTSKANFDGFLKESLKTNVLNLSETGGGPDKAMLGFLESSDFKNAPPKLLIWELPIYYDLNKLNSFYAKTESLLK